VSLLKQLGKDALVYGIGGAVGRSISFLILPVYTRIFSPAEYGMIEMMTVLVSLLTVIIVMGLDSAQSFYFFEQKKSGAAAQKVVVSAILQWRLAFGIGIVVCAGALAPLLNQWLFSGGLSATHFAVAFAGALFLSVMTQGLEILRLIYRPWPYIAATVLNTLVGTALVLLFVIVFRQSILGFFLGSAIASFAVALLVWYRMREYVDFSAWHCEWWPRLLGFGAPLLFSGLALYVMSTSDRWFVQHFHGEAALGVYAVGAKFALIMAVAVDTFRKAWWPIAMDAMHGDDGPEVFRVIGRLCGGLGVAGVVYLAFLAPWLVKWLTVPAFHDAWRVVGLLSWQAFFYGLYVVVSVGLWKSEKTHLTAVLIGVSGALNLGLSLLWVPSLGGTGAALANAVSYFALIVLSLILSERYWRVRFPLGVMGAQIALGAFTVAWLTLYAEDPIASAIVAHLSVLILVASALPLAIRQRLYKRTREIFA
jgi:O-antigen/teichoic acid export membrane protein